MVRGARLGDWRRPGWFGHAAWASFALLALVWLWGALSGGLDIEETCRLRHHEPYDEAYYQAHRDDYFRLFPLSQKCNAGYDLVAPWVNPAVAVLFLLLLAALTGLVGSVSSSLGGPSRRRPGSPPGSAEPGRRERRRGARRRPAR